MFVTATDRVRAEIENRIVNGSLPPGAALDEAQLSEAFSVSRTPVREALLQLSALGFIRVVPRSGIYVVQLSEPELTALLEVLAYAEGLCASLVAQRISAEALAELMQLHTDAKLSVDNSDMVGFAAYNKAFHESLYINCGNVYLAKQIVLTRKRTNAYRLAPACVVERMQLSYQQHGELLSAIASKDEAAARRLATEHSMSTNQDISELVSSSPQLVAPIEMAKGPWLEAAVEMPPVFIEYMES